MTVASAGKLELAKLLAVNGHDGVAPIQSIRNWAATAAALPSARNVASFCGDRESSSRSSKSRTNFKFRPILASNSWRRGDWLADNVHATSLAHLEPNVSSGKESHDARGTGRQERLLYRQSRALCPQFPVAVAARPARISTLWSPKIRRVIWTDCQSVHSRNERLGIGLWAVTSSQVTTTKSARVKVFLVRSINCCSLAVSLAVVSLYKSVRPSSGKGKCQNSEHMMRRTASAHGEL